MIYPKFTFQLEQFPSCCGIGVVHNIHPDYGTYNYAFKPAKHVPPTYYPTREEALKAFNDEIQERLDAKRQQWLDGGDGPLDKYYDYVLLSVVTNYSEEGGEYEEEPDEWSESTYTGRAQFPELVPFMLTNGWVTERVFINPKTKNEVTVIRRDL